MPSARAAINRSSPDHSIKLEILDLSDEAINDVTRAEILLGDETIESITVTNEGGKNYFNLPSTLYVRARIKWYPLTDNQLKDIHYTDTNCLPYTRLVWFLPECYPSGYNFFPGDRYSVTYQQVELGFTAQLPNGNIVDFPDSKVTNMNFDESDKTNVWTWEYFQGGYDGYTGGEKNWNSSPIEEGDYIIDDVYANINVPDEYQKTEIPDTEAVNPLFTGNFSIDILTRRKIDGVNYFGNDWVASGNKSIRGLLNLGLAEKNEISSPGLNASLNNEDVELNFEHDNSMFFNGYELDSNPNNAGYTNLKKWPEDEEVQDTNTAIFNNYEFDDENEMRIMFKLKAKYNNTNTYPDGRIINPSFLEITLYDDDGNGTPDRLEERVTPDTPSDDPAITPESSSDFCEQYRVKLTDPSTWTKLVNNIDLVICEVVTALASFFATILTWMANSILTVAELR